MPYPTRKQAVEASIELGAEVGAHKGDDGQWYPCKTEKAYDEALNNLYEENEDFPFVKSADTCKIAKVDKSRRLVFGWAQICTKAGKDYYDTDNQCFPEDVTLGDAESGWTAFMMKARAHKAMHKGENVGEVVFAFPAFDDVMKSLGFEPAHQTGIITGVYVSDDDTLEKFHKGEYTGFSIGGSAMFEDDED